MRKVRRFFALFMALVMVNSFTAITSATDVKIIDDNFAVNAESVIPAPTSDPPTWLQEFGNTVSKQGTFKTTKSAYLTFMVNCSSPCSLYVSGPDGSLKYVYSQYLGINTSYRAYTLFSERVPAGEYYYVVTFRDNPSTSYWGFEFKGTENIYS